jgi:hypothetical protein
MWGTEAEQREFGAIHALWYGGESARDRRGAVKRLASLAERGYAPAQFALAMAYFDGEGVARDYQQSYRLALAAAEQDYPGAQNMVGGFHASVSPRHDACAHDPAAAVRWYLKAAAQGNTGAMMNLVTCYETGHGVAADPVEVYVWASAAVHCTPTRNRGAETISARTGAALEPDRRAAADDRIARLKASLPHPWSEPQSYWKSLVPGS